MYAKCNCKEEKKYIQQITINKTEGKKHKEYYNQRMMLALFPFNIFMSLFSL